MNIFKIIIILTILLLNLSARSMDKITLQLDWLNQFQFAGYYMAKEKGFYENKNLEVEIKEYKFGTNLLDSVLNEPANYSIGKSSLIIDKLEGKDIVLLAAIYQNSPMVLVTLKNSKIYNLSSLKNKKVMMTPDARVAASINSMLISQGLRLSDINFQEHSFNLDDLINGKTDAMACYLSNEPFILKNQNIDFTIYNPSNYGFDFYGGILFTSKKELENNPKRVKNMYDATLEGWKYAFENIEETAKIIYEKYNTQNKSLDSLIYEGNVLKKLAKFDEGFLGQIENEKIEEMKRLYLLLGTTDKTSNSLNNFIYVPNRIMYSKNDQTYLEKNKLVLVSNDSYPPFTMKVNGKLNGIEIDYWNLINEKLGIKNPPITIENRIKEALKKVNENSNYVKYSFSKSDEKSELLKTNSISDVKIGIATLYDKPYISNLNEIKDKKIAIAKKSSYYKEIQKKYPQIDFIEINDLNNALDSLSKGVIDAVIAKVPAISYSITNNNFPKIKISGTIDDANFQLKISVNKDNQELLKLLNDAISLISDEERIAINNKYYSIVYHEKIDYYSLIKFLIPILIILIIVTINNRILKNEVNKRKEIEEQLHIVANIDSLTNTYNRRKIESLFNFELTRVKRYERPLSIIFFDIDDFKNINDNLGHAMGDEVLQKISTVVKNNIREIDHFGRWGGEEFVIILPETSKDKASNVAYMLKDKISNSSFDIDVKITCSFGVSQYEETDSADSLLTRADNAMYYIKKNGKNGVKVA